MQVVQNGKLIDSVTGEEITDRFQVMDLVVPDRVEALEEIIRGGGKFIHVDKANELKISPSVLSGYIGTQHTIEEYQNKLFYIIGAIVYYSGNFSPKNPKERSGRGYYKTIVKTDMVEEIDVQVGKIIKTFSRNITLASGGTKFAVQVFQFINLYGWYDWKDEKGNPIKLPVIVNKNSQNEHILTVVPDNFEVTDTAKNA